MLLKRPPFGGRLLPVLASCEADGLTTNLLFSVTSPPRQQVTLAGVRAYTY